MLALHRRNKTPPETEPTCDICGHKLELRTSVTVELERKEKSLSQNKSFCQNCNRPRCELCNTLLVPSPNNTEANDRFKEGIIILADLDHCPFCYKNPRKARTKI